MLPGDASLQVHVLGAPILTMDREPLRIDTRKAAAMLVVLATSLADGDSPVPRDRIAALLWPEADEARARGALRRTLSVLIAATGDAVTVDRATLGLDRARVSSDIVEFARLQSSTRVEDWSEAAGLLRGEFLEGFGLRACQPFDEWVVARAATLRRDAGALMERLVRARLRTGELHAALADAARWLRIDPLHEPAHRTVMRLLAWTGRRQDALDAYHVCVRVLADELGVAPVRSTTQVFEAIRTGTLPSRAVVVPAGEHAPSARDHPSAAPGGGPAPFSRGGSGPPPMVGRDAELDTLLDLARPAVSGGRVAVVTGETGAGRSRLLHEFIGRLDRVATARAHEGEAGLAFAPVADLLREALARADPPDRATMLELARILPECLPAGATPLTGAGLDALGGRDRFFEAIVRTLAAARFEAVVLDDVHSVSAAGADFLSYLLYRLDRLDCLLVLGWRTPGLAARHPVRLALATGSSPGQRATYVALRRLGRDDVAALVTRTGSSLDVDALLAGTAGLPLLLAEAVRSGRVDVLGPESPNGGVRDLLAARLAEVTEEAAQVLAALAVCGGVAEQQLLREVSGRAEVEAVDAVEQSLRLGLLVEEGAAVAFSHHALRRVAYEELSLVRRRLLHARAAEALSTDGSNAALVANHWHLAGRDELAARWGWTAAARSAALFAHEETLLHLQFVATLGNSAAAPVSRAEVSLAEGDALVALGRYESALVAYARGATAEPALPLRAVLERRRAGVHARVGDWELADSGLAAGLHLLGDGWPGLRASLLADRAMVSLRTGALDPHDYAAAAMAVEPGGHVQNVLGMVALARGQDVLARIAFSAALEWATGPDRKDGDGDGLTAAVLNNLARAQASADPRAAVVTARRALALGQVLGDRHRLAALHTNLADRLHEIGETENAMEQLKLAAALFAEIGSDGDGALSRPNIWTLTAW